MDTIEELIAAGESILREKHTEDISFLKEIPVKKLESINSEIYNSKPDSLDDNIPLSNDALSKKYHTSSKSLSAEYSNKSDLSINEKKFDEVVTSVKEEFSKMFSVGLSVNSSLINANRLVRAVVKKFCKDPLVSEQIMSEIQQCEESCKNNDATFSQLALTMHHLLVEMVNLSNEQEDHCILITQAEERALVLRQLIAKLISDTGFKNLAKQIFSERTCLINVIEDSQLGLTLLSGELPNHVAKYQNDVLKKNQLQEIQIRKEFSQLQQEYDDLFNSMQIDKTNSQIEIEKLNEELDSYKHHVELLKNEKTGSILKLEEVLKEAENVITKLRQDIIKVQQEADERVRLATISSQEASESEDILKSKVQIITEQLNNKAKDLEIYQNDMFTETNSLKNNIKKLENDLTKEKSKISRIEDAKKEYSDKIKQLGNSLEVASEQNEALNEEIQLLKNQLIKSKHSYAVEIGEMQEKLNDLSSTLCDKHSEIRSRDVQIMQMQIDLQLEQEKVLVTNSESDFLRKQVDRLQNKIQKLVENRPKGEQAILLHTDKYYVNNEKQKQDESLGKIQTEMHKLLLQKDEEMKKLQDSLSSEILQKNNDLERLSRFVERLEQQMCDVTSALSLSNNMAEVSTRVASRVQNCSSNLANLQESSIKLRDDYISKEKKCQESSMDLSYLKEDINSWRSSTKKARDEARAARLELAKEKQKNSYLQIDLESVRSTLRNSEISKLFHSSRSPDDSKIDQLTSADNISTVLEISESSDSVFN